MAELEWLDGYGGQTLDELIALEGSFRTDSLVLALEQAIDQKAARDADKSLSDEELIILAIEAMEREVNNGGWDQFFVNTGQFAPIIVNALKRIRCPKTAEIAQRAVNVVEKMPITVGEIESGTWEENDNRQGVLRQCDDLYFQHPENIEEGLFAFIKSNRANIKL